MRTSESEYKKLLKNRRKKTSDFHCARESGSVYTGDAESDTDRAYAEAMETLLHLQSTGGDLFLGCSDFVMQVQITGKTRADGSNIYKGAEDALNKIAWHDDKQNRFFQLPPRRTENTNK